MKLSLYTDGGARGNPGPAGIGIVVKNEKGEIIKELGLYIGEATNNDAEYQALILGLENCLDKGAKEVTCFLDSQLVVRQLLGEYKVKNSRMKKYWNEVKRLEKQFGRVNYDHVKRSGNEEADFLVNQVLEAVENA